MTALNIHVPHEDEMPNSAPTQRNIPWNVIWAVIAFVVGIIFSAGMGWGRNSTALDNMSLAIARLEGAVNTLSDKYTLSDKAVAQELQKIEDHLSYSDQRLDRLEGKAK